MTKPLAASCLAAATALALVMPAAAADLRVGVAAEPSSADPHFHNIGTNNQLRRSVFESLVDTDATQALLPGLAESWEAVDDTTWRFNLRKGVKFSDGSDFDAWDVVYTVCRIPNVADSPSPFTTYTKAAIGFEVPDPHTLIVKTAEPYPLLPTEFSTWGIISAKANGVTGPIDFSPEGCGDLAYPTTQDFNDGKAAVGTGPFLMTAYRRGEGITLERNPDYWGEAAPWDKVTIRPLTADGPRVAALLAGDVDLIENPPLQDLARLEATDGVDVVQGISNRVIYLHMDSDRDQTPMVRGTDANPLKDPRVRQALSLAIDRQAIVDRIMQGVAVPAGELLPAGMFGAHAEGEMPAPAANAARAQELLTEAGYPDGFQITLATPNDRYINDAQVSQAIAQMWSRVGVATDIDASTSATFFSRRNNLEFSAYLAGWGSGTGEMSSPLKALVATHDPAKGYGGANGGRFSNPEFDAGLTRALNTVDDDARAQMLRDLSTQAMTVDYAVLPIHFEVSPWAMRSTVTYVPRVDQYTLPYDIRPAE
ncbi:MAG: ABC transporter substrate-binding protein [Paracoccus sp. (in: a-proteobacteria)]|uniref:ABC transporter substrate-binding protein n=1 Tax=Paracoccus sp. TaxID=267 RepID=UPI0026E074C3|nr:ABC transporter substrate-binding protein [Paracoccus sp. (in: a-proteobacteria)]MDO5620346.1 ABC transporter substrate-binding protein [Paracoccus sp. (in: a-proteobacteria)]